jgi:hypothetical protein
MEFALFSLVMLAVGWLVLWCCADHSKPTHTWWPFDFRSSDPVTPPSDKLEPDNALRRTHLSPKRPWKRSGF